MTSDPWKITENNFPHNGSVKEKIIFLLGYATLAPSSHNTQPWKYRVGESSLEITPDYRHTLAYSDRTLRELYISLGCSIENFNIAAAYFGLQMIIDYLPEDTTEEVAARIELRNATYSKQNEELFSAITRRITYRLPYETKPIEKTLLQQLRDNNIDKNISITIISEKEKIAVLSKLAQSSSEMAFNDKIFKKELSQWVRENDTLARDGMPFAGFGLSGKLPAAAEDMIMQMSGEAQAKLDALAFTTTPACLILGSTNDTKEEWLRCGQVYERISLIVTNHKIGFAPMAGLIEQTSIRSKLHKELNLKDIPLFFARMGYMKVPLPHSPRRPVEEVLAT